MIAKSRAYGPKPNQQRRSDESNGSIEAMNQAALKPSCLDLFCGCGGFSLGMQRAGFSVVAAIDSNKEAAAVYERNFPSVPFMLQEDLTTFTPDKLAALIWPTSRHQPAVDLIVGGPPCQG